MIVGIQQVLQSQQLLAFDGDFVFSVTSGIAAWFEPLGVRFVQHRIICVSNVEHVETTGVVRSGVIPLQAAFQEQRALTSLA